MEMSNDESDKDLWKWVMMNRTKIYGNNFLKIHFYHDSHRSLENKGSEWVINLSTGVGSCTWRFATASGSSSISSSCGCARCCPLVPNLWESNPKIQKCLGICYYVTQQKYMVMYCN